MLSRSTRTTTYLSEGDQRREERAAILELLPANDNEVLPRARRNKGAHPEFAPFLGELAWWAFMSNDPGRPPLGETAGGPMADTLPSIDSDATIVPSLDRMVPDGDIIRRWADRTVVRVAVVTTIRKGSQPRPSRRVALVKDVLRNVEWENGRCARVGDHRFRTEPANLNSAPAWMSEGASSRAGSMTDFLRGGRWIRPSERREPIRVSRSKAAEAARTASNRYYAALLGTAGGPLPRRYVAGGPTRASKRADVDFVAYWAASPHLHGNTPLSAARTACGLPPSEKLPAGLPTGAPDIAGQFLFGRVNPKPGGGSDDDDGIVGRIRKPMQPHAEAWFGDRDDYDRFRTYHPEHSAALDATIEASAMVDVSAAVGSKRHQTGKLALLAACAALKNFRQMDAA